MLVVAAMRWVRRANAHPLSGQLRTERQGGGPSEADHCALEHALRIAEKTGGRCVAVSLAPVEAEDMLRDALARGAESVLRVVAEADPADSEHRTARALAAGITSRFGVPDLVLTGDLSADRGTGSTPAFLAAEFDCAQALGLVDLSYADGRLLGLRRLDRGRRERLAIPLPAVCAVEPTGVRLRRAGLEPMLTARKARIPWVAVDVPERTTVRQTRPYRPRPRELPPPRSTSPRERVRELTSTAHHREPPRIVVADPNEAAGELLTFLRDNGYLDG